MTLEESLYSAISGYPALKGIQSYINVAGNSANFPYIVSTLVSGYGNESYTLSGESLIKTRWQIDTYSNDALQAIATGNNIIKCLEQSFGAVCINKQNSFEKATISGVVQITHRTLLEFSIWM